MPTVGLTATAARQIDTLIETHELPQDSLDRVLTSLEPLERFPYAGRSLHRRWEEFRLLIGPWPWMLLVHVYDEVKRRVRALQCPVAAE